MTCRELIDFLMHYLDGELAPEQRSVFDAHLAVCDACRRYLATYEESVALGKAACGDDPDQPVPPEVPEELVQAILAARTDRRA